MILEFEILNSDNADGGPRSQVMHARTWKQGVSKKNSDLYLHLLEAGDKYVQKMVPCQIS